MTFGSSRSGERYRGITKRASTAVVIRTFTGRLDMPMQFLRWTTCIGPACGSSRLIATGALGANALGSGYNQLHPSSAQHCGYVWRIFRRFPTESRFKQCGNRCSRFPAMVPHFEGELMAAHRDAGQCPDFTVACFAATGECGQMLRPEGRRRRIWLHDCSLCRVLYFAFIVGRGNPCAKKAATQTMFGCKKKQRLQIGCMYFCDH